MLRARNRRRREKAQQFVLPAIHWLPVLTLLGALLVGGAATVLAIWVIDRPVTRIVIHGQFERVSADQLEALLRPQVGTGFLRLDMAGLQRELKALPWVASARLTRRWPETLELLVREQEPAARWGEAGLLNPRGELFIEQASHIPGGLPRLHGPAGTEARVARRFIELQEQLVPRGLGVVELTLDERGAWSFRISNGISVRLGSARTDERLAVFYQALDQVVGSMASEVDYIDMRYTNGFAIGWKAGRETQG
ncbi:MAG: cell division protein FtsQ/DivIB [Chromatiales bacterium]|nr:cell division protein FtsQ/DivIB [Chromatiales bacterium]